MSQSAKVRRCDSVFDELDVRNVRGKLFPRTVPYGFVHDTKSYWSSDYGVHLLWTLCNEELQSGEWWGCGTDAEVTCPACIVAQKKGV